MLEHHIFVIHKHYLSALLYSIDFDTDVFNYLFISLDKKVLTMEDLIENAKTAGRGGAVIFFSNILSTLISAFGAILVIRLLSPSDYGLYTIASIPASMIVMFGDWGVNSALTKFIAQYRAEGNKQQVALILRFSLIFKVGLSVFLTSVMFFLSDFLAGFILQKPEAALLVKVSSLMFLGTQLYNTSWSIFLGFGTMKYNALIQILFSALKAILATLLVFLGLKSFGAMAGLSFGNLVAGVVGILIVLFVLSNPLMKTISKNSIDNKEIMRLTLGYGFPLAIISLITGFGSQFYSFLMARYSPTDSVGNYGVASTFTVFVSFITFPVLNILLPTFSKMSGAEAREGLEVAFRTSIKYVSYLVLPVTVGVMALSQPLISLLFGEKYNAAALFLILSSVGNLFYGLGSLSMNSLLSSQGETNMVFKIGLLTMIVGIPSSLILIPYFGVIGFIVTNLIVQAAGTLMYIYWIKKLFKFKMWINQSAMTYFAAFTMGALVWVTISALRLWVGINNEGILLGTGFLIGLSSYFLLLPLTGGIELTDLENIKVIFGKSGFLSTIVNILYVSLRKIIAIRSRHVRRIN